MPGTSELANGPDCPQRGDGPMVTPGGEEPLCQKGNADKIKDVAYAIVMDNGARDLVSPRSECRISNFWRAFCPILARFTWSPR